MILAEKVNITFRIDAELKKQAEQLFSELGISLSTALNIFLHQSVREQKIPFDITLKIPNPDTIAAMVEAERISRDPAVKGYTNVGQMLDEFLSDDSNGK